jgi:hypothetical protein
MCPCLSGKRWRQGDRNKRGGGLRGKTRQDKTREEKRRGERCGQIDSSAHIVWQEEAPNISPSALTVSGSVDGRCRVSMLLCREKRKTRAAIGRNSSWRGAKRHFFVLFFLCFGLVMWPGRQVTQANETGKRRKRSERVIACIVHTTNT